MRWDRLRLHRARRAAQRRTGIRQRAKVAGKASQCRGTPPRTAMRGQAPRRVFWRPRSQVRMQQTAPARQGRVPGPAPIHHPPHGPMRWRRHLDTSRRAKMRIRRWFPCPGRCPIQPEAELRTSISRETATSSRVAPALGKRRPKTAKRQRRTPARGRGRAQPSIICIKSKSAQTVPRLQMNDALRLSSVPRCLATRQFRRLRFSNPHRRQPALPASSLPTRPGARRRQISPACRQRTLRIRTPPHGS